MLIVLRFHVQCDAVQSCRGPAAGIRGTGGRISHAVVSCLHMRTSSLGACSVRSVVLGGKNLDLTKPGNSTMINH